MTPDDDQNELRVSSVEKDDIIYYEYLATNEDGKIEIRLGPVGVKAYFLEQSSEESVDRAWELNWENRK